MRRPYVADAEQITLADLARLAEQAGLGRLDADELASLKRYYDGLRPQLARLRAAFALTDEPATVFSAQRPSSSQAAGL
jgi:hypothetical protein